MRAAALDGPDWKKETARSVAEMIMDGLIVGRVLSDQVKIEFSPCKCNKPQLSFLEDIDVK
jgi:hypothetical protein